MRKQQQAELRRLEEALMAEDLPEDADPILDETWLEYTEQDYEIYNTDDTDVDLDAYSDDVHEGGSQKGMGALVILTLLLLLAVIVFLLKFLGVI